MNSLVTFLKALHTKSLVEVEFIGSNGDKLQRLCAPMDYGPSQRCKDPFNRFHFYNLHQGGKSHPMAILPKKVLTIKPLNVTFDPAKIVKWHPDWYVPRDWGTAS